MGVADKDAIFHRAGRIAPRSGLPPGSAGSGPPPTGTWSPRAPSPEPPSELGEHREAFWKTYIRVGFAVLVFECVGSAGYFAIDPGVPHRSLLLGMASATAAVALCLLPLAPAISRRAWREQFVLGSTLGVGIVLFACAALDGGLDSPLVYLIVLPVAFSAAGMSLRHVVAAASASFVEFALLVLTDPRITVADSIIGVQVAVLVGIGAVSVIASVARTRLEVAEGDIRAELARLSVTDATSGCLNARGFHSHLEAEVDRSLRYGSPLSLLVADIDLFKSFNDTFGHAAGDAALGAIGACMRDVVRGSDVVARIGGDEFAVLFVSTPLAEAVEAARRLRDELAHRQDVGVTLSMGVAVLGPEEPTPHRLFRDADLAMYRAKATGRDRIVRTSDPVTVEARLGAGGHPALRGEDRQRLEDRVRQAAREKREAFAVLDALEATAPVGLCLFDSDYRLLRINGTMSSLAGAAPQPRVGAHMKDVLPALWPRLSDQVLKVARSAHPLALETLQVQGPDGRCHYWLYTVYPVLAEGRLIATGVMAVDATDRHEAEAGRDRMLRTMLDGLSAVIDMRDPYTVGHMRRVGELATAIAREMGLDDGEVEDVELAARVHDIGKVRVPVELLVRPGRLSRAELDLVRDHARMGYDVLSAVGCPDRLCQMVLQHHERVDGSGYPQHLRGTEILLGARIIAVADVLEAMQSTRPYRAARGHEAAIAEIARGAGTLYDADVAAACMKLFATGGPFSSGLAADAQDREAEASSPAPRRDVLCPAAPVGGRSGAPAFAR